MNSNLDQKLLIGLIVFTCFLLPVPIFAEKNYHLQVDKHVFDIEYDFDGSVIAMAVDKELNSLLIATENVRDTIFQISLPSDLISAQNNEFAVLVNGFEADYNIILDDEVTLVFFVPDFTEEIEIIGTYVIPEFPFGALLLLTPLIGTIIIMQRTKNFLFK